MNIDFSTCSFNTKAFSLNGYNTKGRLVDIIDGDSLHIVLPMNFSIKEQTKDSLYFYKYNIRLFGIDTCELKSKNDENKKLGIQARNKLLELVLNKGYDKDVSKKDIKEILENNIVIVFVECLDFDKYGRLLANVYFEKDNNKINFSEYLLSNHLAYKYTGG